MTMQDQVSVPRLPGAATYDEASEAARDAAMLAEGADNVTEIVRQMQTQLDALTTTVQAQDHEIKRLHAAMRALPCPQKLRCQRSAGRRQHRHRNRRRVHIRMPVRLRTGLHPHVGNVAAGNRGSSELTGGGTDQSELPASSGTIGISGSRQASMTEPWSRPGCSARNRATKGSSPNTSTDGRPSKS